MGRSCSTEAWIHCRLKLHDAFIFECFAECAFIKHDICQDRWCQQTLTLQFKMLSSSTILLKMWMASFSFSLFDELYYISDSKTGFVHYSHYLSNCGILEHSVHWQAFIPKFRFRLWIIRSFLYCMKVTVCRLMKTFHSIVI